MGTELPCRATVGDRSGEGRAMLETTELVFRGDKKDFRFRVPFESIKKVVALGDRLVIDGTNVHIVLELGAKYAARWAEKIRNPPTRIEKMGVEEGMVVSVIGVDDILLKNELEGRGAKAHLGKVVPKSALILFGASKTSDLARLAKLKESLTEDGGIWVVRPKGVDTIREQDVRDAARAAGLVDVKVCAFSPTHTADKFVVPVVKRKKN
jgi:hypothetical protein